VQKLALAFSCLNVNGFAGFFCPANLRNFRNISEINMGIRDLCDDPSPIGWDDIALIAQTRISLIGQLWFEYEEEPEYVFKFRLQKYLNTAFARMEIVPGISKNFPYYTFPASNYTPEEAAKLVPTHLLAGQKFPQMLQGIPVEYELPEEVFLDRMEIASVHNPFDLENETIDLSIGFFAIAVCYYRPMDEEYSEIPSCPETHDDTSGSMDSLPGATIYSPKASTYNTEPWYITTTHMQFNYSWIDVLAIPFFGFDRGPHHIIDEWNQYVIDANSQYLLNSPEWKNVLGGLVAEPYGFEITQYSHTVVFGLVTTRYISPEKHLIYPPRGVGGSIGGHKGFIPVILDRIFPILREHREGIDEHYHNWDWYPRLGSYEEGGEFDKLQVNDQNLLIDRQLVLLHL
jgi:hypothetical protein